MEASLFFLGTGYDTGSKVATLADLKVDLDGEKAAQIVARVEADVLSWAVRDLKISADRFASQIPTLEDKVKHQEDKVVEGMNKVRAWELCLERTTRANDDYQKEVA
jgi:glutamine synthetase type III